MSRLYNNKNNVKHNSVKIYRKSDKNRERRGITPLRSKGLSLLFALVIAAGLFSSVLGVIFPGNAHAATDQITVKDVMTYSGAAPSVDVITILPVSFNDPNLQLSQYTGAQAEAKNPALSNGTATFTYTFTSLVYQPGDQATGNDAFTGPVLKTYEIPTGVYIITGNYNSGSDNNYADDGSGTATIKGAYIPNPKVCTTAACEQAYKDALAYEKAHPPGGTGSSSGTGTASATSPTCDTSGFSLSWIVCPFINGLSDSADHIYEDAIQPLLVTEPLSLSGTSPTFKVWSDFRVLGDIFLVIALLVIVFGESVGGGVIDAYTAKKVLPRLLFAAILINISYYLVAGLVDITNIVGGGLGSLLSNPFQQAGVYHFTLNGGASTTIGIATIFGGALTAGTIWATIVTGGAFLIPLVSFFALFVLLPLVLIMIAILVTVIIRRGIIILLVMVSPVAFALYCLPNTEKYFRKWWELLFKTLLVYPIIGVVFALSNVLAVTISLGGNSSPLVHTMSELVSLIALIAPLFLIPFSFRLAGGVIGQLHGTMTQYRKRGHEAIKGNPNDQNSLRNKTRRNASTVMVDERNRLGNISRNKRGLGLFSRAIGGPAISRRAGINNKIAQEQMQIDSTFGDDRFQRAVTIPLSSLKNKAGPRYRQAVKTGPPEKQHPEQWQTADGSWQDEQTIRQSHRFHRTQGEIQRAYGLVMEKAEAGDGTDQNNLFSDFLANSTERGLDVTTAVGRWQGVAIPHQASDPVARARSITQAADGSLTAGGIDHNGLVKRLGNNQPNQLLSVTASNYPQIVQSIVAASSSSDPKVQADARSAATNVRLFVEGATPPGSTGAPASPAYAGAVPPPPAPAPGAATPPAGAPAGAAGGSPVVGYSASGSAAAKNAAAATQALADLRSLPAPIRARLGL